MAPSSQTKPRIITISEKCDDPRADVALQSSDGVEFRLRRHVLTASSGIFDDMFLDLSSKDNEKASTGSKGKLPVTVLAESAAELELFLPFVCREQVRPATLEFEQIKSLFKMSDK